MHLSLRGITISTYYKRHKQLYIFYVHYIISHYSHLLGRFMPLQVDACTCKHDFNNVLFNIL